MGFTPEKRADFVALFGEETAAQLEAEAAKRKKDLIDEGVQHKDATEAQPQAAAETEPAPVEAQPVATPATPEVAAPPPAQPAPALDAEAIKAAFAQALDERVTAAVAPLMATVSAQQAEIAALKDGLDKQVAEALRPRIAPVAQGVRASEAAETAQAATPAQTAALKTVDVDFEWVKSIGPLT